MNHLDPIEDLYDMYSGEEEVPQIVKIVDKKLDLDSEPGDRLVRISRFGWYEATALTQGGGIKRT